MSGNKFNEFNNTGAQMLDSITKSISVIHLQFLGLWVLGLAVSHINESNCKLMSPEHYF